MQAPPGGPEDKGPAEVVLIVPESGAVNFSRRVAEFRFNEVISDRGTGAAALGQLVLVSPREGAPRVAYRREAVAVRPRSGWRPNTTYTVTVLPGVTDLRGNTTKESHTTVFSTGNVIAPFTLRGRVFDWMAERPAARAWVEATSLPDSVVYITVADSSGLFTVGPLPAGSYTVKAYIDQNTNRALDRNEAWDSVVTRTSPAGVETNLELLAALRDTVPPRITGVSPVDSMTLSVEFDRGLDVAQPISPALFSVVRADSTPVPVREALGRRDFDAREASRRAQEDSARADTARAPRAAPPQPRAVRAGSEAALRPSRPPPITQVVLRLGASLVPGSSYRVSANGVRNLVGRPGTTSRVVQIPRPATDTTRRTPPP
jgi:Bacterial Ig-like domain